MSFHSKLTESDGIHQPYDWQWANKTAQDAESIDSDDISKYGYRQDSGDVVQLMDLTPTWQRMGGKVAGNLYELFIEYTHASSAWERLLIGGVDEMVIPSDTVWAFTALVVGTTQGVTKSFAFKLEGAIENDGGTTAIKGSVTTTVLDDSDDTSFDARAVADDAEDSLAIEVSDSDGASDTVLWYATVTIAAATYAA